MQAYLNRRIDKFLLVILHHVEAVDSISTNEAFISSAIVTLQISCVKLSRFKIGNGSKYARCRR